MKKSFMILCGIILTSVMFPSIMNAQEAFLDYTDKIPTEIVIANDQNDIKTTQNLISVDTMFIDGFAVGESESLPEEQLGQLDALIAGLSANQYLFFRGTADSQRWVGSYRDWESPRLNLSLAMARSKWVQSRAGRGKILLPLVDYPGRGILVYIATYGKTKPTFETVRRDTIIVVEQIHNHYHANTFIQKDSTRFELGVGYSGLFLFEDGKARQEYNVSTVQALLSFRKNHDLMLVLGWREKNESNDELEIPGDRTETYASLGYTWWPGAFQALGVSINGVMAYENIQSVNEYIERAEGITIGPRLRILNGGFRVYAGIDVGYFVRRKFEDPDIDHSVGLNPSLRINYTF